MNLLEKFESLDLSDIENYVANSEVEDLYLDFKEVKNPELTRDDRKNLAKALSGFANSSGGLIIWGIEARKNSDDIDCAVAKKPIESVRQLLSVLNGLTGTAVVPIVEGVRHKIIEEGTTGQGYAVTLVPESDSGTHMAKQGENRYYKRSGDSFYQMEHFDIADMFGRRKKPVLTLSTRIVGIERQISIYLGIENLGRGSAHAPYLGFNIPEPFTISQYELGNNAPGLPRLLIVGRPSPTFKHQYGADTTTVIHPGTFREVTALSLRSGIVSAPDGEIIIEYELAAEGYQLQRDRKIINLSVDRTVQGQSWE